MTDYTKSDVTFVIPSRENLEYLKFAYKSIRTNIGTEPFILCADDFSVLDGTKYWLEKIKATDSNFDYILNEGPERVGHVVLYNDLVQKVKTKLFVLSHADMVWLHGSLDGLLKYMAPKHIISSTRCEPAFHPSEQCKITLNWLPDHPSKLNESELETYLINLQIPNNTTSGVFAPYLMETEEYLKIGGIDELFKPTSREDDDLWNRLILNNCTMLQSWESFVYHRSCAGSRWNPKLTKMGENSLEWDNQQPKSMRNYIRKWGAGIRHTEWHLPIIQHKYNLGFVLKNPTHHLLYTLEPWCDKLDMVGETVKVQLLKDNYIKQEQPNTNIDLDYKINCEKISKLPDIIIEIDGNRFTQEDMFYISNLSEILTDSGEVGEMKIGNLYLNIARLNHYETDLIIAKNEKIELN